MTSFFENLTNLKSKFTSSSLNKLTDSVSKQLSEARQKLHASDSSLKVIAKNCIDDAEDSYQEAIYSLKEGSTQDAIQYCKKAISYLGLSFLHLSKQSKLPEEPEFQAGDTEDVILELAKEIAHFKSVVEYTNCELGKEEHDRYMEVVGIFYRATEMFANQDNQAQLIAYSGLLSMFQLSCQIKEMSGSGVINEKYLLENGPTEVQRITDLISATYDARCLYLEASEPAKMRTNKYLEAASKTIEESIFEFKQGRPVAKLVKAGKMEVRMAKRLIESSFGVESDTNTNHGEDSHNRSYKFKARVAYLQQLIKENDPDRLKLVRRLYQVSSYYGLAVKLKEEGDYTEAERYARSAHLDIDYARQLFSSGQAFFSESI